MVFASPQESWCCNGRVKRIQECLRDINAQGKTKGRTSVISDCPQFVSR